jgi:hypothetical protein
LRSAAWRIVIPLQENLQSLNDPTGLFILTQPLLQASFQHVFVKTKNPAYSGVFKLRGERGI